jgi:hypothetical protein
MTRPAVDALPEMATVIGVVESYGTPGSWPGLTKSKATEERVAVDEPRTMFLVS